MLKKIISVLLILCTLTLLLAACGKEEAITSDRAKEIVQEELGEAGKKAQLHVHAGDHEGTPCYSVYVTMNGKTMEYKVDMMSGEILAIVESNHSH